MKFVVAYKLRDGGSLEERVHSGDVAQKLLANWTPKATIHQWVQRADGNGGFAISEADDAATIFKDLSVWGPWLEFDVTPVIDIIESIPLQQEALDTVHGVL